jgi:hypothetical protein
MAMGDKLKSIGNYALGTRFGSHISMGNKLLQAGKLVHSAVNHNTETIDNHTSDVKTPMGLNLKKIGKTSKSVLEK